MVSFITKNNETSFKKLRSSNLKTWGIKYLCPGSKKYTLTFSVDVLSTLFLSFLLGFGFEWEDMWWNTVSGA